MGLLQVESTRILQKDECSSKGTWCGLLTGCSGNNWCELQHPWERLVAGTVVWPVDGVQWKQLMWTPAPVGATGGWDRGVACWRGAVETTDVNSSTHGSDWWLLPGFLLYTNPLNQHRDMCCERCDRILYFLSLFSDQVKQHTIYRPGPSWLYGTHSAHIHVRILLSALEHLLF
jgi:hypothetical protein